MDTSNIYAYIKTYIQLDRNIDANKCNALLFISDKFLVSLGRVPACIRLCVPQIVAHLIGERRGVHGHAYCGLRVLFHITPMSSQYSPST